jgi:Ca-activated chloride channel family protein
MTERRKAVQAKDDARRQVTIEVDEASGIEAITAVPAPQENGSRDIVVNDLLPSRGAPTSGGTWKFGGISGQIDASGRLHVPEDSARYIEPSNESYNSAIESAPTLVRDEPLSTFSIDVDTASYANVRRFIQSGQLPPSDAVRTEEFINYFKYQYPVQTEKPFTLSYEAAPAPLDAGKVLLKLGIKSRDALPNERGWNLVFLIDVSGSMSDSHKLPLLKRTLPILVQKMRPQDRISIVTYAGNAGVALEPTSGNEKFRIENAIQNLAAGGSTYGSGGIAVAYDLAQRYFVAGGVNRVVLATDGDFNVGVTSQQDLVRLIEEKRRSGVTLTTIGVGQGNLKDGMMEQLANKGNGNYFYFDSFKEARKVLETDLVANMEVVAKDVKLQVEFNPQQVAQYRLVGYDNRRLQKQDFNNDAVDAGEIGNGHTVTALYELVLTNSEAAQQLHDSLRYQKSSQQPHPVVDEKKRGELAFVKIRYKEPDGATSRLLEYPILATDVRSSPQQTSDDFRFAAAVGYFANLLKQHWHHGNYSIDQVISLAEGARGKDENGYRQEFIELAKDARLLLQPRGRTPIDQRYESIR